MNGYARRLWENVRSRAARDVTLTAAGLYVSAGLGFATAIASARGLGTINYGIVALVLTFSDLVLTFASVGSGSVTTRYASAYRASNRLDEVRAISKLGYAVDLAASIAAVAAVGALLPLVQPRIPAMLGYGWLALVYAASFPLASLKGTNLAVLTTWARYRQVALLEVADRAIVLVLTLLVLVVKPSVVGVVLAAAIGPAVEGVAGVALANSILSRAQERPWFRTPLSVLGEVQRISISGYVWTYLGTTFRGATAGLPVLFLGSVAGPIQAGYLKLGTSVFNVSSYLESALVRVSYPVLSARWGDGGYRKMLSTLRRWTLRAGTPVAAAILLSLPFMRIAVRLVFGQEYAPMTLGLQILLLGASVSAALFWLRSAYYVVDRIPLWTLSFGSSVGLTLILAWVAIERWAFLGATLSISLVRIAFLVTMTLLLWGGLSKQREEP